MFRPDADDTRNICNAMSCSVKTRRPHASAPRPLQDMITGWSGPFGSAFGQQPGVSVVELSLVESAVRSAALRGMSPRLQTWEMTGNGCNETNGMFGLLLRLTFLPSPAPLTNECMTAKTSNHAVRTSPGPLSSAAPT